VRVSVDWIRSLVPGLEASPEELAHRLSMLAVGVEGIEPVGAHLRGIRVGRVLETREHPNADRLTLCRVDLGRDTAVDVVCGAPVVEEGGLYPYVGPGQSLPGGAAIEVREIRGEESHGMLCSEKELGLGPDASGILRLPDGLEPGAPVAEAFGWPDVRFELDLTPNRVDLACHAGVARELAADAGLEFRLPRFEGPRWVPEWAGDEREATADGIRVRLEDRERCPRYLAAVVRGVEVGPSPAWLAGRLRAVGARPVNNVVDATNYVLRELNQPLHAFDLDRLEGGEVVVRAARSGETLRTLDGRERSLAADATVIADAAGPVALAGVMGGEESEVTDGTTDVLLECAWFDPSHTRRTARGAELSTDASYRFERGVDPRGQETALARCAELVRAVAGGRVEPLGLRAGGEPPPRHRVAVRPARVRRVLGIDLPIRRIAEYLVPLGFDPVDSDDGDAPRFAVPGWRHDDVTREADLIEEIARRHGYETFPSEDRSFRPSTVPDDPGWARSERVRRFFVARGLLEARSSSLVSAREADARDPAPLLHPLSARENHLRGAIVPVLLRRVEHNWSRGVADVRLYEIGTVFWRSPAPERARPVEEHRTGDFGEEMRCGAVLTGRRSPEHWSDEGEATDLWDLKGLAEEVAERLVDGKLVPLRPDDPGDGSGEGSDDAAGALEGFSAAGWLDAERFGIRTDAGIVGVAGRVGAEAVDAPPWAEPVWGIEFRLAAVRRAPRPLHRELSSFPAVHRDLAVTVPAEHEAGTLAETIRAIAPPTLETLRLFDVYAGEGVEDGRRSLAYRFRFRAPDRTLRDEEAEEAMSRIVHELEERFDARVRAS